ncbi:MAG: hypothetical protein ABI612_08945 [Betaproteobacteria bacterium]
MKRVVIAFLIASAAALPSLAQEAPLGRLFLTPQQRAALDNARRYKIRAQAVAATVDSRPRIPAARSVVINGLVQRSDGESVIWVNGKPTDGQMADGTRVTVAGDSHGSVVVRDPERGRRIGLRVGQRADLLTGHIEEVHERRRSSKPVVTTTPLATSTGDAKTTVQQSDRALRGQRGERQKERDREDRVREEYLREAPQSGGEKAEQ